MDDQATRLAHLLGLSTAEALDLINDCPADAHPMLDAVLDAANPNYSAAFGILVISSIARGLHATEMPISPRAVIDTIDRLYAGDATLANDPRVPAKDRERLYWRGREGLFKNAFWTASVLEGLDAIT